MSRGINKVILIDLYNSGLSIPEVSDRTDLSRSAVRYHLKRAGVLRSREEGVRLAGLHGRLGAGLRGKRRTFSESHKSNMSAARLAHAEVNASGFSHKASGYIEHTRGEHKGRGQHRVVMEQYLGRPLNRNEHVHHRDENKSNNDISNLEVLSISEHMSHHANENLHNRRRNKNGTWR